VGNSGILHISAGAALVRALTKETLKTHPQKNTPDNPLKKN